jgi:hypothetical protein
VGSLQLSLVNSDSYWVDAYFEETALSRIQEGDAATIKLMGYTPLLRGRVQGLARGIDVPNAAPDASGLASVNPIFTFVRLAQRVPVRVHIDEVPEGVNLVAGMTATVQIEPYKAPPPPAPASGPVTKAGPKPAPSEVAAPTEPQLASGPLAPIPNRAPADAAPSQAAAQPVPQAVPPQATGPAAPVRGLGELAVSAPPSPEASAAAGAAAADLKTLQQQIAANPPSGAGSQPNMPSSEYMGQTYDLFGGQSATPAQKPRSPDTIRRRARSRWRHMPPRSPSP